MPTNEEQKKDPELDRLRREKEKAELERDIEKAKGDRLRAELPKAETKALEGKISIGQNLLLPGSVLAYASSSEIAKQLAHDIPKDNDLKTIIVYSEKDFGSIAAYHSVLSQVSAIQRGYKEILSPEEPVVAMAAPALLLAPELMATTMRSVADLVALFRTDVEINPVTVTIDEVAIIAEVARALKSVKVIYTPAYLPSRFLSDPINDSDLAKKLNDLYKLRYKASGVIAAFEVKSEDGKKNDTLRDKIPILKSLNDQADKMNTYLSSIDDKTGLNPLTLFLKAEDLIHKLKEPTSSVMLTKIHVGAGSNKTTRNILRSKLYHNGGAVITFLLFDNEGAIRFSKTYYCATAYTVFESPETWTFINNFRSTTIKSTGPEEKE